MKKLILLTILGATAMAVQAETPEFSEADANSDGVLSATEASEALPEILVVDMNSDGLFNPAEAEVAIPGLMLATEGQSKESGIIGPAEYEVIVKVLEENS